jgi:alkanesulfonate monooxygenase SsuD/methylene tetrahydromethanopterin reductase-like flavin-dependent oxidoreductase (luciferase family)
MEFALQSNAGSYEEILEWARFAEEQELAAFGIPDHFLRGAEHEPMLDALIQLGGLARETESIQLAVMVSPVTWRHPAILAKTFATLDDMSGGRFTLGVGTGWLEREHELFGIPFPERGVRFDMMEEALAYLRAAFSDPPQSFEGEHYRFEGFDMNPRPALKIVVGGTGTKRTPELAGRYADELNAYPAPEDDYRAKVEVARAAAVEAGRDPDALLISSSGVLVAGDTPEEYRSRLEQFAAMVNSDVEQVEESLRVRNSPRGTWAEVREILAGMERAGMERFWIQAPGSTFEEVERSLDRLRTRSD